VSTQHHTQDMQTYLLISKDWSESASWVQVVQLHPGTLSYSWRCTFVPRITMIIAHWVKGTFQALHGHLEEK